MDQAYRNGESLRFSLIAEQDCYYHLFVFDADGVEQLYPGAYEEISLYKKGVEYFFPRNQWVAYSVEKGNYPVRYEQNIFLVVATRKDIPLMYWDGYAVYRKNYGVNNIFLSFLNR